MTNTTFPTWAVDGPTPVPPVHSLLQTASSPAAGVRIIVDVAGVGPVDANDLAALGFDAPLVNAGRERWIGGIAVYPYPTDPPDVWNACDPPSAGEKAFGEAADVPEFEAFTVSQGITCTAQQVPDQAKFKARAVAALAAKESYAVAREFMTGEAFSSQPYLADGNGTFPNGDVATSPNHGIQVLEGAIASTGSLGIIHCSPMLATALMGAGFALSDASGVIRTINGVVVIPDFGYANPGVAPVGHVGVTTNEEWAYATGPVDVRRSDVFTTPETVAQALDRGLGATGGRTNTITYRAERYYAVDWDTALQAAVLVDRCGTTCNNGS